ncbi:MAG: NAD-dependent epimerase/dehydratase family protein [Halioglobus sp.]
MKCLVTGATGFIGSRLVPHLEQLGHEVVALSRLGGTLPTGQLTHAVDLSASEISQHLLEGVDVVLHLAGIAHQSASAEAYRRVNVDSTRELAKSAADSGVACFIFLSSVKAMGAAATDQRRDESDLTDLLSEYGASKRAAEDALFEQTRKSSMSCVVLRPALVYGPQPKGNLSHLARAVELRIPCPPDYGRRSMVSLLALLELFALLVSSPPSADFKRWIVCDDVGYSTAELYQALVKIRGQSDSSSWLPLLGWRAACTFMDLISGDRAEPIFEKVFGTELYANDAIKAETGWQPVSRVSQWAQDVAEHRGWKA